MLAEKIAELMKRAGINNPGVPDGTGPARGSFRRNVEGKGYGRRLEAGGTCPVTGDTMVDKVENAKKKTDKKRSYTKEDLLAKIRSKETGPEEDKRLLKLLREI